MSEPTPGAHRGVGVIRPPQPRTPKPPKPPKPEKNAKTSKDTAQNVEPRPEAASEETPNSTTGPSAARRRLLRLLRTDRSTAEKPEPADTHMKLALAHVIGNLTITRAGIVTAWYVAAPQRWSFRSDADRNGLLSAHAQRLAELSGRRLHLRVTHRPYPVHEWARALHESALDPLPGWEEYLTQEQQQLAGTGLDDKVVYWGVEAGRLSALGRTGLRLSRNNQQAGTREVEALAEELEALDQTLAAPGMDAAPASAADMDWLLSRSLGLGLPAPAAVPRPAGTWEPDDLAEYLHGTHWSAPRPFGPGLHIAADRPEGRVERHVSISSLGQMELAPVPESGMGPWLQRLDRLPWPVEISGRFVIREGPETSREITDQLARIRAQITHHHEHGIAIPLSLDRQGNLGYQVEDDVRGNFSGLSTRVQGWLRLAVTGVDERQVRERSAALSKALSPHITVHRGTDQYRLAREFIPGEPLSTTAHRRRMPVTTLAGALPTASAEVGDKTGPRIGHTSGLTRRPVMWHPWRSQEVREGSGLTPVLSTLGGGKTFLCGGIVDSSVRMGAPWVVLDPSGPVTRLCDLPHLRPHSRKIDLMSAEPGTLNPYRIIPDPDPAHFRPGDEEFRDAPDPHHAAEKAYRDAVKSAAAQRTTLATDVLAGLLRSQISDSAATQTALMLAAHQVQPTAHSSPHDIIAALRRLDGAEMHEHGKRLASLLEQAAELPQGQLIFPGVDAGDDRHLTEHHRLVVMSLRGLTLPSADSDRAEWSWEEQYSMPLLYLAGWYAQRSIYHRDMSERKGLWLDEAHEMLRVASGRTLLTKTGRDSRKHNVRALYATQDGDDILTAGISNWVDAVFVGRTVGADAQAAALRLLGIEPGNGYEDVLASLSRRTRGSEHTAQPREFVFADGDGGMERITVTLGHRPDVAAALDSTARPHLTKHPRGGGEQI